MRAIALSGALVLNWLSLGGPAYAQLDYQVRFEGVPNGLADELKLASGLASKRRPAPTRAALALLARRDTTALISALHAAGYYAAEVAFSIDGSDAPVVAFALSPGRRFRITDHVVRYADDAQGRPETFSEAEVAVSNAADGAALEQAQRALLDALWNKGYPAARMIGRRAEADLEAGTARAVFVFESGPRARFGALQISGAQQTDPDHFRNLATWEQGELYDRNKLVAYRDRLTSAGIFASVAVEPGAPGEDGAAPVIVDVEERKRRTIGAGLSYSTIESIGARLFFEYRNLFGRGERARVEAQGSGVEQSLLFDINKPLPAFPGAAFGQLGFTNETTDAFNARTVRIGAGLSRLSLDNRLDTRAGVAFETSKVRAEGVEERNYLVSLPLSAVFNSEDDLLNPARGLRAGLAVTPYVGSSNFTTTELNARTRVNFGADDRFTTAVRARLGSTIGSTFEDIPLNRRFYAGGGASVRGYGFQEAGPLDTDGLPTGGRSVLEAAAEVRARVTERIQAAAFIDAGTVSPSAFPSFEEDIFVGAGAGVRYFTPIGPIRLDIATPLRKRESDRAFQLYISLGQPF